MLISKRAKVKSDTPSYKKKEKSESGGTIYRYDESHIERRWKEKEEKLKKIEKNIGKLRTKYREDLKSDDERTCAIAAIVGIMDDTAVRIGNEASAREGTFGASTLKVKHVSGTSAKMTFKFPGKGGIKQDIFIENNEVIKAIKSLMAGKSKDDFIFEVDGKKIWDRAVNRYLEPMGISAKDIRGFHANRMMKETLKRKSWEDALKEVSEIVGHEENTLKNQYLERKLVEKHEKKEKKEDSGKKDDKKDKKKKATVISNKEIGKQTPALHNNTTDISSREIGKQTPVLHDNTTGDVVRTDSGEPKPADPNPVDAIDLTLNTQNIKGDISNYPDLQNAWSILAPFLSPGATLSSGWRSDNEQAKIILEYWLSAVWIGSDTIWRKNKGFFHTTHGEKNTNALRWWLDRAKSAIPITGRLHRKLNSVIEPLRKTMTRFTPQQGAQGQPPVALKIAPLGESKHLVGQAFDVSGVSLSEVIRAAEYINSSLSSSVRFSQVLPEQGQSTVHVVVAKGTSVPSRQLLSQHIINYRNPKIASISKRAISPGVKKVVDEVKQKYFGKSQTGTQISKREDYVVAGKNDRGVKPGVKVNRTIMSAWLELRPHLPAGAIMTSGARDYNDQVRIINNYWRKSGLDDRYVDISDPYKRSELLIQNGWIVGPPTTKRPGGHLNGRAFDVSGADLKKIELASNKVSADSSIPVSFSQILVEDKNNAVHIEIKSVSDKVSRSSVSEVVMKEAAAIDVPQKMFNQVVEKTIGIITGLMGKAIYADESGGEFEVPKGTLVEFDLPIDISDTKEYQNIPWLQDAMKMCKFDESLAALKNLNVKIMNDSGESRFGSVPHLEMIFSEQYAIKNAFYMEIREDFSGGLEAMLSGYKDFGYAKVEKMLKDIAIANLEVSIAHELTHMMQYLMKFGNALAGNKKTIHPGLPGGFDPDRNVAYRGLSDRVKLDFVVDQIKNKITDPRVKSGIFDGLSFYSKRIESLLKGKSHKELLKMDDNWINRWADKEAVRLFNTIPGLQDSENQEDRKTATFVVPNALKSIMSGNIRSILHTMDDVEFKANLNGHILTIRRRLAADTITLTEHDMIKGEFPNESKSDITDMSMSELSNEARNHILQYRISNFLESNIIQVLKERDYPRYKKFMKELYQGFDKMIDEIVDRDSEGKRPISMRNDDGEQEVKLASISKRALSEYGWWLSPDGKLYDVERHGDFMIKHPELFGVIPDDEEYIYNVALRKGWVRIVNYRQTLELEFPSKDKKYIRLVQDAQLPTHYKYVYIDWDNGGLNGVPYSLFITAKDFREIERVMSYSSAKSAKSKKSPKRIGFPKKEIEDLKKRLEDGKHIYTTRIEDERGKYSEGEKLSSDLGPLKVVDVTGLDLESGTEGHPFDEELTKKQKSDLSGHKADLVELKKSKKASISKRALDISDFGMGFDDKPGEWFEKHHIFRHREEVPDYKVNDLAQSEAKRLAKEDPEEFFYRGLHREHEDLEYEALRNMIKTNPKFYWIFSYHTREDDKFKDLLQESAEGLSLQDPRAFFYYNLHKTYPEIGRGAIVHLIDKDPRSFGQFGLASAYPDYEQAATDAINIYDPMKIDVREKDDE